MNVSGAILEFSKKQPVWVQDAMRRLATKNDLSERDVEEIMIMLKAQHGISGDGDSPSANPLSETHLKPTAVENGRVALLEVSNIKRVNRLAEGQRLRFSPNGLTIIYGDNGSGKSGYCRLLKKLCRVREGAEEPILPDAFEPQPDRPAEATVRFHDESRREKQLTWLDGNEPPAALRHISVFDSSAMPLYVDRDGRVDYLPYGLDLLPRLGHLLQHLAGKLRDEQGRVEARCRAPLPPVPQETEVARVLARLDPRLEGEDFPSEKEILTLACFSQADTERLEELGRILSGDTKSMRTLLDKALAAAGALLSDLPKLTEQLDDGSMAEIRRQVHTAQQARKTATLAARQAFTKEPLAGVGSDPWRQMFEYARAYSRIAYPGEAFPVTRPGARCVLCQQELNAEARDRLKRFDAFVREASEKAAKEAEAVLAQTHARLEKLQIPDPDIATRDLGGFEGADEELRDHLRGFLKALLVRRRAAVEYILGKTERLDIQPLPVDPSPRLAKAVRTIAARSKELRIAQTDPDELQRLKDEQRNLQARKVLVENLEIVQSRRKDLELLQRLRGCVAECDTTALSRKSTELRRKFVTDAFRKRLEAEVGFFDISYLPLDVADRTERGESFVGVSLDSAWNVKIQDVLSEGERKAVALAVFFAEIGGLPPGNGLVFDDPVSSLDHSRRGKVAERLVSAAGGGRQVIVFTHDLVFFNELQVAAAEATPQVPVVTHEVQRTGEHGFGTVEEETEPWLVAKVGFRISRLERKLGELRRAASNGGQKQREAAISFYSELRITWEKLVESELLNGVVTRFTKDVKTQSLKGVVVEDEDYRRIYFAMKKVSSWSGHSPPPAAQPPLPTAQAAAADLQELKDFLQHVKNRKKEISESRKALERPPTASLL